MLRSWILIALALVSFPAHASDCSKLLEKGIYDIRRSSVSVEDAVSFADWYCDQSFKEEKAAKEFGLSLGLPFAELPVNFNFNESGKEWSTRQSEFCRDVRYKRDLKVKLLDYTKKVNEKIVDAFNRCTSESGLYVWIERTNSQNIFIFATRFVTPHRSIASTRLLNFDPGENVTCNEDITKRDIGRPEVRMRCVRNNDDVVSIVVNAEWEIRGGGKLSLPSITRYPPPPPQPPQPPQPNYQKLNAIYVGRTPYCNEGILTTNAHHLGCVNTPVGHTVSQTAGTQQPLYVGAIPNLNQGTVTSKAFFNGGNTDEIGYTISDKYKPEGAVPIYVVVGCTKNWDGEVTTTPGHRGCPTIHIGYLHP